MTEPTLSEQIAYIRELSRTGLFEFSPKILRAVLASLEAQQWRPIETAPIGEWGWCWHEGWRCAFPGIRNGDNGAVYVDTCDPAASGWQTYASHWMPAPPRPGEDKWATLHLAAPGARGRV